jgi:hypothetical protein
LILLGQRRAEIAIRNGIATTVIFHSMTVNRSCDPHLSYTPPVGSPLERHPDGRPT